MKKLYLSRENKKLAGLCGGVGALLHIDPMLVRLLMVFGVVSTGIFPLLITYIIAWVIVPVEPEEDDGEEDDY
jgi:phage shock protein C